jgi:hypothetical protein
MNHEEWGEGPWNNEPDDGQWVDPTTDLDCMIHRGPMGALCGYVGVGRDHPMYGKQYMDIDVEVHGGLTYSNSCQEGSIICHVPEPGREHDIWWLGFDCAHAFDYAPGYKAQLRERAKDHPSLARAFLEGESTWMREVYRDWEYVKDECAELALQLVQLKGTS